MDPETLTFASLDPVAEDALWTLLREAGGESLARRPRTLTREGLHVPPGLFRSSVPAMLALRVAPFRARGPGSRSDQVWTKQTVFSA